jgi:lipid-A-disaccharide synthase
MTGPPPKIFMVAGETSGDLLGARLMAALREATAGRIAFDGVGGEAMAEAGLASRFPMRELSLMGLAEVLPHLPRLLRRLTETADAVRTTRPAVLVTIDAPAFGLRLARRLAGAGVPRVHYVAPQHWAWRPGRARALPKATDLLLALLPFEPAFFAARGVACRFVGHPVVEGGAASGDGVGLRGRLGLGQRPLLLVLPGSRRGEIERLTPVFAVTARRLVASRPHLALVVGLAPGVAARFRELWQANAGPTIHETEGDRRFDAMAAADLALAASGTVALELALAGCPSVIAYRVHPATALIARRLVTLPFKSLPNIVAGRELFPERLQEACEPTQIARDLTGLLDDPDARASVRTALTGIAAALGGAGEPPSRRAAAAILELIAPLSSEGVV